ncbi:MAG: hypothetical protein BWY75_01756 [bacterium ADurb.Bin425]|nr:MAG: hypothetical protein BWY75_01756 [bacterium ADurb.Bin425]
MHSDVPLSQNLFQTLIGLKVKKATRFDDTHSTFFEFFDEADLAIFGEMSISPAIACLSDFHGDRIASYSDSDPLSVTIQFESGKCIRFKVIDEHPEYDPAPDKIIYTNKKLDPPGVFVIKRIDDFFEPVVAECEP